MARTKRTSSSDPDKGLPSGSIARALSVLSIVAESARPVSSAEIATQCSIDPSTAHRLLLTLANEGYLLREESSKRYIASPKLLFPLPLYHPWYVVRREAAPIIHGIRDRHGFTTGFVVFALGERVLLDLAIGKDPLSPHYQTWLDSPLHASGSGLIYLMASTLERRRELLGPGPYHRYTEKTVTSEAALSRILDDSAERGFVTALDDYIDGFSVVAAPLCPVNRETIGCFFCSGRSSNLTPDNVLEVATELKKALKFFALGCTALQGLADLVSASPPRPSRAVNRIKV